MHLTGLRASSRPTWAATPRRSPASGTFWPQAARNVPQCPYPAENRRSPALAPLTRGLRSAKAAVFWGESPSRPSCARAHQGGGARWGGRLACRPLPGAPPRAIAPPCPHPERRLEAEGQPRSFSPPPGTPSPLDRLGQDGHARAIGGGHLGEANSIREGAATSQVLARICDAAPPHNPRAGSR